MRLHLHRSWHTHGDRPLPAAPAWWRKLSIARLRNPLDQFIVTIELVCGAAMLAVGAVVAAATGARWPWAMIVVGLAVVAIALVAVARGGGHDERGP